LLARELSMKKNVKIMTTNVFIARQFRRKKDTHIILLGGIYQHQSETLVGKITKACIDQININKAFIGIDGYSAKTGFTLRDLYRAEISSYIVEKSQEVFIVTDSSKFGKTELTNVCYPKDIQHLATDKDLNKNYQDELSKSGVDLILA
jgi:DeoR/GlpR family transcriptional regulator of sugar metabolism